MNILEGLLSIWCGRPMAGPHVNRLWAELPPGAPDARARAKNEALGPPLERWRSEVFGPVTDRD
jgi:hypothetical protein